MGGWQPVVELIKFNQAMQYMCVHRARLPIQYAVTASRSRGSSVLHKRVIKEFVAGFKSRAQPTECPARPGYMVCLYSAPDLYGTEHRLAAQHTVIIGKRGGYQHHKDHRTYSPPPVARATTERSTRQHTKDT